MVAKKSSSVKKEKPEVKASAEKLTLPIYDMSGKAKSTVKLESEIFAQKENPKLLAQYIRVYLTNRRQGNASTKTRAEVRGSTRKIYKQKGTGRARHGAKYAPIFVGGGISGGPKPKDYSLKMNKKQKRLALFLAFSHQFTQAKTLGLDVQIAKIDAPKTQKIAKFLAAIDAKEKKALFIVPQATANNFTRSVKNLPSVQTVDAISVNPYILLNNDVVIFVEDALEVIEKHFIKKHAN